jgi:predicted nucleotide-binding protein
LEGAKAKVDLLIEAGRQFTYENFSTKSRYGYPDAFETEWVSWRTRVEGAIRSLFDEKSSPVRLLVEAGRVQVIGHGSEKFALALSHYMGALDTARLILEEDTFGELQSARATAPLSASNRVFVVHGHDEAAKQELEIILTEMGLEPIVLHRQSDGGRTIIEKFEHYSDVGFAFIILTPDEITYPSKQSSFDDSDRSNEFRARPNVIFEFGYFVGRLGRNRTCCLLREGVVPPSDIQGLVYKKFLSSVEEVAYAIAKELKAAGYKLK